MADMMDETDQEVAQERAIEVGTIEALAPLGMGALDRGLVDVQIATAKQFPRSIAKALKEARELATENEAIAETMYYRLPKRGEDGKPIQGPSARLAEIMLFAWGNARAQAAPVSEDGKYVTAMGTAFDLERNVARCIVIRRRITNKYGKRFNDDMINVTSNAASSIAVRNAVLALIPRAFVDPIYKAAQLASVGKGTIESKRTAALDYFAKQGYAPEAIYEFLGVKGLQDVGIDEIIELRGIINAVKDGETTLQETFNPQAAQSEEAAKLDEALAGSPEKPTEAAVAGAGTPPTVVAAPAVPPAPEVAPGPAKRVR